MALSDSFPGASGIADSTDLRKDFAGTIVRDASGVPRAGVFYRNNTKLVTARAGDMKVDIGAFNAALVRGAGPLFINNDGVIQSSALPVPSSNSIIHVVYVKQNETAAPYSDAGTDAPFIGFVSSPVAPVPDLNAALALLPDGALPLSSALVPFSATSTASAGVVLTDIFPYTAMAGGLVPFRKLADLNLWTNAAPWQHASVLADSTAANNGDYVFASGAWTNVSEDTGWITAPLSNSWVNFGGAYATAQYRRLKGMVYVKGVVKSGSVASGTAILTLPIGFRPAEQRLLATQANSAFATITITTAGVLQTAVVGSNASLTIDCSFPADA